MANDKTTKRKYVRKNKPADEAKKNIPVAVAEEIDIREAAKQMKLALKHIAVQMAELPAEKRAKKAKSIAWMGYDVQTIDGNVVVAKFVAEKTKKSRVDEVEQDKPVAKKEKSVAKKEKPKVDDSIAKAAKNAFADDEEEEVKPDDEPKVELVPAGDLLGSDGQVDEAEIANLDSEDDELKDRDEDDDYYDDDEDADTIRDSRDETDEDMIANRREYFSTYGYGDDDE